MATPLTATSEPDFFARGRRGYTCSAFCSSLCKALSSPIGWLIFFCSLVYDLITWPCCCGSFWDVCIKTLRHITYSGQAAHFKDGALQGLVDLLPFVDSLIMLLVGRGVATCPLSTTVLKRGSDVGRGEWLWPKGTGRDGDTCPPLPKTNDKVILYIHGGAFVLCNHTTHRLVTTELVRRTGAVVVAPEYTRPPQAQYPVALDEMVGVYSALLAHYPASRVIIAGDSAGGNLSLTVALAAAAKGLPKPAGLLLLSPWCDLTASSVNAPSMSANAPTDYLPLPMVERFATDYSGKVPTSDALISPMLATPDALAAALPPTFVAYGTGESLEDQVRTLVGHMHKAGVLAGTHEGEGMPHVYPLFASLVYGTDASAGRHAGTPPVQALEQFAAFTAARWSTAEC